MGECQRPDMFTTTKVSSQSNAIYPHAWVQIWDDNGYKKDKFNYSIL